MNPIAKALMWAFFLLSCHSVWGNSQSRVSVSQASFVSPDYQNTARKDFHLISAGFDTLTTTPPENEIDNGLQGQVYGMVAPGESVLNYLDVSQLYWKQAFISVGRKKIFWNDLDDRFRLGVFQPLFQWNPLQWESQGLTGIFLHAENTDALVRWGATFMGSPLFIPNQGPGYEIKNGVFEKTNPYFPSFPSSALINGKTSQIQYDIRKPELQDIVARQSLAARLFVGDAEAGPYGQVSFAQKPMNELVLGAKIYQTSDDIVKVEVTPTVVKHQILGGDFQFTNRQFKIGVSALQENPQEAEFGSERNFVIYKKSTLLSPFLELKTSFFEIQLAALSVQGGESEMRGPDQDQAGDLAPQRYPFRNAGLLGARFTQKLSRQKKLILSSRYLRGERGEFDVWTSQASLQWASHWTAHVASQLVDVADSADGRATLYEKFLNNDLVAVGVSYVF